MPSYGRPSIDDHRELQQQLFRIRCECVQIGGILQKLPKHHSAHAAMRNLKECEWRLRDKLEGEAGQTHGEEVVREIYMREKQNPEPFPHNYQEWWTPEHAARITGIPLEDIKTMAEQGVIRSTLTAKGRLLDPGSCFQAIGK